MERRVEQADRDRQARHLLEQPLEVLLLERQQLRRARRRSSSPSAMIIARIFGWRSAAMNMCSVRQRPMPSAPNSRALRASVGRVGVRAHAEPAHLVGPLEHALEVRVDLGLHERHVVGRDHAVGAVDRDQVALVRGRCRSPAPRRCPGRSRAPRPRPRTAGPCRGPRAPRGSPCRPRDVRIPWAAKKPATSSASVKGRTARPCARPRPPRPRRSAENTISPFAAPGEALTPRASTLYSASRPKVGCSSASSASASIVASASSRVEQALLHRVDREAHGRLRRAAWRCASGACRGGPPPP